MSEFFSLLKIVAVCGTVLFLAFMVLLSLPQCRLRAVGVECSKWALAVGLALLVPSPVDVIPDVVPGIGWLDDVGYIAGAVCAAKSALNDRRKRLASEQQDGPQGQ